MWFLASCGHTDSNPNFLPDGVPARCRWRRDSTLINLRLGAATAFWSPVGRGMRRGRSQFRRAGDPASPTAPAHGAVAKAFGIMAKPGTMELAIQRARRICRTTAGRRAAATASWIPARLRAGRPQQFQPGAPCRTTCVLPTWATALWIPARNATTPKRNHWMLAPMPAPMPAAATA